MAPISGGASKFYSTLPFVLFLSTWLFGLLIGLWKRLRDFEIATVMLNCKASVYGALTIMNLADLPREYCKGPILIGQNLWNSDDAGSGCSVLDIKFPRLIKIAGISFKNHYVAELQIWLKYALKLKTEKEKKSDLVWAAAVPKMILMPHPHFEKGGGENFTVLLPSPYYVAFMRIVLKQPSFQWNRFFIYQLSVVEDLPHNIRVQEPFMDSKIKKRLELMKSLEKQTKKSLMIPKHKNEGNIRRSDRINNEALYEMSLFSDID